MRLYQNSTALALIALFIAVFAFTLFADNPKSSNFDDSINGNDNLISGNVVNTRVQLFPASSKNCSFHLYPGWNMVSFYCFGMFLETAPAMDSISGSYEAIFSYSPLDVNDPWKSYNPYLPSWAVQQLSHVDRVSGYWIYMFNDANFQYPGVYSDSVFYFSNGWNLVGYPLNHSSNISTQLSGVPYTLVRYYNTSTGTWLFNVNGGSGNTLKQFDAYKGYWINVSGSPQWNIARS